MCIDIQPVLVLKDNYTWLIHSKQRGAIVVDPGEAAPVVNALGRGPLEAILLTHYHRDHTAGAEALKQQYGAEIYGPDNVSTPLDHPVQGGETFQISGIKVQVLSTPGHATGHVSYVLPEVPALFSGDVLFSGGSGRLFDGTAEDLFKSLRLYDVLPDQTLLCAGHEYTLANMKFIAAQGENSEVFQKRYVEVEFLRNKNKSTLPVSLGVERQTNPFLRASSAEELARLRRLKDEF